MNNWLSLLPPIIAVVMAFATKKVVPALFIGLLSGVIILHGLDFSSYGVIVDPYLVSTISDLNSIYLITFSLFISGTISVLHHNGGMDALLRPVIHLIHSRKQAQWATFLSGLILFFDDYANSLVVGNTMRPITDKYRISREKLAYLVDSTSAPVTAIALVTTWIGAQLGYIDEASKSLNLNESAYSIFLNSLTYAFYPVLTLVFIIILSATGKDFGPMWKAETQMQKEEEAKDLSKQEAIVPFWYGATPIVLLLLVTFYMLIETGSTSEAQSLGEILGNADSYTALLYGSSASLVSTLLFTFFLTPKSVMELLQEIIRGFGHLVPALLILIFSWALGDVILDLKTAEFIISHIPAEFPVWSLAALVFVLSAIVSFATGSSWGTMAIVYPLAIPLAYSMMGGDVEVLYACVASVLGGAVFGDHCSPISDTTILSSMASHCDHIQHVKTQLPYALTVGGVVVACLLASYLVHSVLILLFASVVLLGIVHVFGKKI